MGKPFQRHSTLEALILLALAFTLQAAEPKGMPEESPGTPAPIFLTSEAQLEIPENAAPEDVVQRAPKGGWDRSVGNVRIPRLYVYRPTPAANTGTAILIFPGGGYRRHAIDKEGHDVARWLQDHGITGIVVQYRLPTVEEGYLGSQGTLMDASRAIRWARQNAGDWKINPKRIGVMGFSAGGHLASTTMVHFDQGRSNDRDPIMRVSGRPDFGVLVYPVISLQSDFGHMGSRKNLLGDSPHGEVVKTFSTHLMVREDTPPCFLVHAEDDGVKVQNSKVFHEALAQKGIATELLLFPKGGHGFGLGIHGGDPATWPDRMLKWLQQQALIKQP